MVETEKKVWAVRAGRYGEREEACIAENIAIAGWPELNEELPASQGSSAIRRILERTYEGESKRVLGNWEGQLDRFVNEMRAGDYLIMPRKGGTIAVGIVAGEDDPEVKGGYHFRSEAKPGYQHVRGVKWCVDDIPRSHLADDLRNSYSDRKSVV